MSDTDAVRTYGGWRKPASPGVGPLKLIPTIVAMTGLVLAMLVMMMAGFWIALAFAAIGIVAFAPAVIPFRGRTLYAEWSKSWRWRRHKRAGRHLYRSGLTGVTPTGQRSLPGLLAPVQVWEAVDAMGREFALVEIPGARQWAVVFAVASQGGALVDEETRDIWVAQWGEYLAFLGQEGAVVQVAAIVETIPDGGAQLRAHVRSHLASDAPEFARQVAIAAAEELPSGVTDTIGHVTLTFSERELGIARQGRESPAVAVSEEIGRRLPTLSVVLRDTGASEGLPLTASQLARRVREAFDPEIAASYSEQEAAGEAVYVEWSDAGPSAHEEGETVYRHDSGWSRTYEAVNLPPGVVRDDHMARLIRPMETAPRKRVAMLYRPVDAAETAAIVDRDLKSAINRTGRRKGLVHAHDSAGVRAARKATEEEADGAGVTGLSVMVTVTVTDLNDLDKACSVVERAAKGGRFRLSPVRGAQAAAFAGALGVGLSLPDLSLIPHVAREHI